ncbi:hypothetical protein TNCV_1919491 [Trichonephila clavipes]|nr:hypothetical protein TNCV_1919491 [Trichonephila clavipes]
MPKKKCALHKGLTKWPILEESVANWVLENRQNGLIIPRNSLKDKKCKIVRVTENFKLGESRNMS